MLLNQVLVIHGMPAYYMNTIVAMVLAASCLLVISQTSKPEIATNVS